VSASKVSLFRSAYSLHNASLQGFESFGDVLHQVEELYVSPIVAKEGAEASEELICW